ncbi:MAG: glycosyltransferase family 4 protein [Ilumatobacteraceae bacterium]
MKVLVVLNSLAPGGTEQSTVLLAPELRKLGVDIAIVTLKRADHELDVIAEASGTRVIRLRPGNPLQQIRELRRLIRSENPHIVHTALFEADQLGRVAALGTGVPVVSSMVNTPYDAARLQDPNVQRWKLRTVQVIDSFTGRFMATRFHAVSEGVKAANARALHVKPSTIVVAERGRDISALGARSAQRRADVLAGLGIDAHAHIVLSLGRLEHQKAHVDLLAAAALLHLRLPGLVVLIAGKDGSASSRIKQMLDADPALAATVILLGHRSDVGDLLAAADVLAISSHFEGTAGVALEAMAVGTPIVSTDLDGLRGVLADGRNAVLVKAAAPVALADGLERVLTDPELAARIAGRAQDHFLERFTLPAAAQRMRDLYQAVSARAS